MAGSLVTLKMLNGALSDVRQELCELDLLTERLDEVNVYLTPFHPGASYGYYVEESPWLSRWLGWDAGHIYIPSLRLASIGTLFGYSEYFSLRNVLRHEYGHALADRYPRLVTGSGGFSRVFGGSYKSRKPAGSYNPLRHISGYAATRPCEDFAETFALYVKRKGNLFKQLYPRCIFEKLSFVESLARKIGKTV